VVAQSITPECRVVYVDNDPIVLSHARALLKSTRDGAIAYIDADVRDPRKILAQAAHTLDFAKPTAIMLVGIPHLLRGLPLLRRPGTRRARRGQAAEMAAGLGVRGKIPHRPVGGHRQKTVTMPGTTIRPATGFPPASANASPVCG
jgi:hypothetical protein